MYGCQRLLGTPRGTGCGSIVIAKLLLRTLAHVVAPASLSEEGRPQLGSDVSGLGNATAKMRVEKVELELRARHSSPIRFD